MKIWHQSMGNAKGLGTHIRAIEAHSHKVCEEGTKVVVHGLDDMDFVTSAKNKASGAAPADMITTDDLRGAKYIYHLALGDISAQGKASFSDRSAARGYARFRGER